MRFLLPLIVLIVVIVLAAGYLSAYVVNEYEQALVFEFGRIARTISEPGLYWKTPFIQTVRYYEKRVLEYDSKPREVITKDKKTLIIDNFARWRIVDPAKYHVSVVDENGAQSRLDDIIYSELRAEVGRADIVEVIRTQQDEEMTTNRKEIMDRVTRTCDAKAREYGISILDVRIKRADLLKENEEFVFNRMRTERQRIADRFRAEGSEESYQIRAEADKQKTIIEAEAYRQAQEIRGEGDAGAISIYAEAFQQDADFYRFMRTLEAYENSIDAKTTLILSTKSEYFHLLTSPRRSDD